uniref:Uncharacterized protein n=1 Tax=Lepeophtheirus salmonis TaxID=72036 RepID=A0A0K2V0N9_LEPSM
MHMDHIFMYHMHQGHLSIK